MPVYWAAGLTLILYLLALPVRFGAAWRTGQPLRLGVTVGPIRCFYAQGRVKYEAGGGLVASLTHEPGGKTRELSLPQQGKPDVAALCAALASLRRAVAYLRRHVRPDRLKACAHLAFADAAQTALFYGALHSLLSALRALLPELPLRARVSADVRPGSTQVELYGILSCRLGHIMTAALIWSCDYLARRLHAWIDSRSKAS